MRYLITGLLTGALLSLIFLQGKSGSELLPIFHGEIASMVQSQGAIKDEPAAEFVLSSSGFTAIVDEKGQVRKNIPADNGFFEFSRSGNFFARYSSTGNDIELFGIEGERYWKIESRGKPFLSTNGRLILLLTSDHSSIRIIDKNGKETGAGEIHGRLCTVVEFSHENDYGACGFADGSFYFINGDGVILHSGITPDGSLVKGIAVSSNGLFGSIHYGDTDKDYLMVVNLAKGKGSSFPLDYAHVVKTSLFVSDEGDSVFFDMNRVISLNSSGRLKYKIDVPEKRAGFSAISSHNGLWSLSYTGINGLSRFILFRDGGDVFYSADFADESFLDSKVVNDFIFLRGSKSLSVYSFLRADN